MKNFGILAVLALAGTASAQVSYTGGSYAQNFDTLPNAGTNPLAWTNNITLQGWYGRRNPTAGPADIDQIRHDIGTSNSGALYSYGNAAGNPERALGSVSSGTPNTLIYALTLTNNTGSTLTEFTLGYTGEQWRDGGGTTAAVLNVLDLDYTIVAGPFNSTQIDELATGYTDLTGNFDFTAIQSTTTAQALNGNSASFRTTGRGGTVTGLNWQAGETLVLRWRDINNFGNDQGLALDDLTFSAIPTPGAASLLALAGVAALRRRRA